MNKRHVPFLWSHTGRDDLGKSLMSRVFAKSSDQRPFSSFQHSWPLSLSTFSLSFPSCLTGHFFSVLAGCSSSGVPSFILFSSLSGSPYSLGPGFRTIYIQLSRLYLKASLSSKPWVASHLTRPLTSSRYLKPSMSKIELLAFWNLLHSESFPSQSMAPSLPVVNPSWFLLFSHIPRLSLPLFLRTHVQRISKSYLLYSEIYFRSGRFSPSLQPPPWARAIGS